MIVLALAVALVLLGRAQSGLFDRARMKITDWLAPTLELVHTPVLAFNRWVASAGQLFNVYQENLALKDENARLRQWRNVAVVMQDRVHHYQDMLHAVPDPDVNSVLAQVIGRASRPFLQTMILGAGERSNVKPGEAVVDAARHDRAHLSGGRSHQLGDPAHRSQQPHSRHHRLSPRQDPALQAIMTGDNTALPILDTLSQQRDPAMPATRWSPRAMAAFCRPACRSARWSARPAPTGSRCWPTPPPPKMSKSLPSHAAGTSAARLRRPASRRRRRPAAGRRRRAPVLWSASAPPAPSRRARAAAFKPPPRAGCARRRRPSGND